MQTRWQWTSFNNMSSAVCYKVLQLRAEIFIEEQGYAYQDIDDRDQEAIHLLGYSFQLPVKLIAYARIIPPHSTHDKVEISRVVVDKEHRQHKVGSQLLTNLISKIDSDYPQYSASITISVDNYTTHLEHFYGKFGFKFKAGEEITTNPNYVYKNFKVICREMIRPPSSAKKNDSPHQAKQRYLQYGLIAGSLLTISLGIFSISKMKKGNENEIIFTSLLRMMK